MKQDLHGWKQKFERAQLLQRIPSVWKPRPSYKHAKMAEINNNHIDKKYQMNKRNTCLVHLSNNSFLNLPFKWSKHNALILHRECHKPCPVSNQTFPNVLYTSYRHHKTMSTTAKN